MAERLEPGAIRRRDDGTFEFLRSTTTSLRHGHVEQWESAAEHAARYMRMPDEFFEALREAGYRGGRSLYDLLIAEGWKRPHRDYIEIDAKKKLGTEPERKALGLG